MRFIKVSTCELVLRVSCIWVRYHHWITIDDIIINRQKMIWFGGVRLCCHFLFHVIFLNIYSITHRIYPGGFSTKGAEPAKSEFSLLALPRWFSKFEGATRYLHHQMLHYWHQATKFYRLCSLESVTSWLVDFFQIITTVEHKFSLLLYS